MAVISVASTVVVSVAYGGFASFELFYYICIALALTVLFVLPKFDWHIPAGILLFTLGFLVNSFFWSYQMPDLTAQILNFVLTADIFIAGASFIHAILGARNGKKVATFCALMLSLMIFVVAVYNLVTKINATLKPIQIAAVVVQNIALLATMLLPACIIKYLNEEVYIEH